MRLKLICCEVFTREACLSIAHSPHTIDPIFTPKAAHELPDDLRAILQTMIDEVNDKHSETYDYIILGFGICGNSTIGLKSEKIPMVIPRAHDCCTLFLGSRDSFVEHFGEDLSAEWTSVGYMERGYETFRDNNASYILGLDRKYEDYVKEYGEDNAKYIWDMLHPRRQDEVIYIDVPEFSHLGTEKKAAEQADKEDKHLKVLKGDMNLIKRLVHGKWDAADFLIIPAGNTIKAVYDHIDVVSHD